MNFTSIKYMGTTQTNCVVGYDGINLHVFPFIVYILSKRDCAPVDEY